MSGLKGAAGGPPNPYGPRGMRAYRREGRKRDCPPGSPRAIGRPIPGWMPSTLATLDADGFAIKEMKTATEAGANAKLARQQLGAYQFAAYKFAAWAMMDKALRESIDSITLIPVPEAPPELAPCEPIRLIASYMASGVSDIERTIRKARATLNLDEFDTLVGRGLSGALVVPPLARALGKRWAIVRKSGEGSHSNNAFEGECGLRWLFVDDLVGSGETLKKTAAGLWSVFDYRGIARPVFAGAFIYTRPEHNAFVRPGDEYFRYASDVR